MLNRLLILHVLIIFGTLKFLVCLRCCLLFDSSTLICLAVINNSPIAILKLIIDDPPKLINGNGTPVKGIVPEIPPKLTNV